jgi:hypothetical protein
MEPTFSAACVPENVRFKITNVKSSEVYTGIVTDLHQVIANNKCKGTFILDDQFKNDADPDAMDGILLEKTYGGSSSTKWKARVYVTGLPFYAQDKWVSIDQLRLALSVSISTRLVYCELPIVNCQLRGGEGAA